MLCGYDSIEAPGLIPVGNPRNNSYPQKKLRTRYFVGFSLPLFPVHLSSSFRFPFLHLSSPSSRPPFLLFAPSLPSLPSSCSSPPLRSLIPFPSSLSSSLLPRSQNRCSNDLIVGSLPVELWIRIQDPGSILRIQDPGSILRIQDPGSASTQIVASKIWILRRGGRQRREGKEERGEAKRR